MASLASGIFHQHSLGPEYCCLVIVLEYLLNCFLTAENTVQHHFSNYKEPRQHMEQCVRELLCRKGWNMCLEKNETETPGLVQFYVQIFLSREKGSLVKLDLCTHMCTCVYDRERACACLCTGVQKEIKL